MFKDFEVIKKELSILRKSFITISEGIIFKCLNQESNQE
jgi:hypothetical protein